MKDFLEWIRGRGFGPGPEKAPALPTHRVVEGLAVKALLRGFQALEEGEKEELLRALLLALSPELVALARGRGPQLEELYQEAALRLLVEFFPAWRETIRRAGLFPALRLWLKTWAGGYAESLAWGVPETTARRLRALRARAARGDKGAQEELDKLLLEGVTVSLEGLAPRGEDGEPLELPLRDPRPFPGEDEAA
jgi:hypothetical protein